MELHNLKPKKGSVKDGSRRGRGQASGTGGTAGRGHKGQQSRSGYSKKRNFEGGQTPLQMRVPKRGFNNPFRKVYIPLNLVDIQRFADKYEVGTVDMEFLLKNNIVRKRDRVKVLGKGKLTATVNVEVHKISSAAKEAIEAAGGTVKLV